MASLWRHTFPIPAGSLSSWCLVQAGVGLFPDAVTARGARHIRELTRLAQQAHWRAAVLFVVQRPDARRVIAAREIDPTFADALETAKAAGVRGLGRRYHIGLEQVTLGATLPAA